MHNRNHRGQGSHSNEDDEDRFPLLRACKRARLNAQQQDNSALRSVPSALPANAGALGGDGRRLGPSPPSKAESFSLYIKLDKDEGPGGIPEAQFSHLFRRCFCCRTVTTARTFQRHQCALPLTEVIDLTVDENAA